jgi:nucleotide-binding universal stress UspA family protein
MTDAAPDGDQMSRHRIVVGTDGSAGAQRALRWAFDQATLQGADLDLVIAWDFAARWATGFNPEWPQDADHLTSDAVTVADASVTALLGHRARPDWLHVHADQGPPALVLTERSRGADLLVVGSRGRGGFSRLLLGSVSSACVQHATCPVVVVPAEANAPT